LPSMTACALNLMLTLGSGSGFRAEALLLLPFQLLQILVHDVIPIAGLVATLGMTFPGEIVAIQLTRRGAHQVHGVVRPGEVVPVEGGSLQQNRRAQVVRILLGDRHEVGTLGLGLNLLEDHPAAIGGKGEIRCVVAFK